MTMPKEESLNVEEPRQPNLAVESRGFFGRLIGQIDELQEEGKVSVGGCSFVTHLTSMYWGCRGIPENMLDLALPVLLKELQIPTGDGQAFVSIAFIPWAMKPFFAIVSDLTILGYYKKRWYMALGSSLGAFAVFSLYSSTPEQLGMTTGSTALIYYLLANAAIALCDSLSQGKYTEICKWKGSTVVSYVSGSKTSAGIVAACIAPFMNQLSPQITLGCITPFLGQAAIVQAGNFMGDHEQPTFCGLNKEILKKDYKLITTGITLGMSAILIVILKMIDIEGIAGGPVLLPVTTLLVLLVLGMCFWSLPRQVASINVYIIFCRVAALDVRYALQNWYTALEVQCQGTPHFPLTVYQTIGVIMGNLFALFGVWLFENYVYRWQAQRAFWVTTVFTMLAACFDLAMIEGWNRAFWSFLPFMSNKIEFLCTDVEGNFQCEEGGYRIDDLISFVLGNQGIKYIATTLDDMPSTILLSKLCPVGVETTVFAILAALMNLGLTFSGLLGAAMTDYYGVQINTITKQIEGYNESNGTWVNETKTTEYTCDVGTSPIPGLSGFAWILVIGGIILPFLTIPATFCLIPDQLLCDDFVEDSEAAAETGGFDQPSGTAEQQQKASALMLTASRTGSRLL